jgi:hypothetical protein
MPPPTNSYGIKANPPILALRLTEDTHTRLPKLEKIVLVGARRSGAHRNGATWHYALTSGQTANAYGALYERPPDELIAEIQEELIAIEQERQAALQRLAERRERALAALRRIPASRESEIVAYLADRAATIPPVKRSS